MGIGCSSDSDSDREGPSLVFEDQEDDLLADDDDAPAPPPGLRKHKRKTSSKNKKRRTGEPEVVTPAVASGEATSGRRRPMVSFSSRSASSLALSVGAGADAGAAETEEKPKRHQRPRVQSRTKQASTRDKESAPDVDGDADLANATDDEEVQDVRAAADPRKVLVGSTELDIDKVYAYAYETAGVTGEEWLTDEQKAEDAHARRARLLERRKMDAFIYGAQKHYASLQLLRQRIGNREVCRRLEQVAPSRDPAICNDPGQAENRAPVVALRMSSDGVNIKGSKYSTAEFDMFMMDADMRVIHRPSIGAPLLTEESTALTILDTVYDQAAETGVPILGMPIMCEGKDAHGNPCQKEHELIVHQVWCSDSGSDVVKGGGLLEHLSDAYKWYQKTHGAAAASDSGASAASVNMAQQVAR
ncbi:unnamed protein product, partial [Amoebophrya sp. A25]|eukprot:GSA25T00008546001.1